MKLWRKPLDADEFDPPKGKVCIIDERCKGCGFCEEFCPRKVLEESEKYNSRGYHPPIVVNPDDCVDCELCELICPEFAIFVLDAKEEEKNEDSKLEKSNESNKTEKAEGKDSIKEEGKE
jgi:2-oxoglutarate ferredoxin oxidoreductase subunit delta